MSHWNHRVVKERLRDGTDWYSVREVFYNNDGSIYAYTEEPVDICGESVENMREYCQWVMDCLDKDILVDGEVKFVEPEDSA
jgi:tetrahydromethanopterin S-methyltransferase subunit H